MKAEASEQPALDHQKLWRNPAVIIVATLLLFVASELIGSALLAPISHYVTNQNYQGVLFIAASLVALLGLLTSTMKIAHFNWRQVGWRWPKPQLFLLVIPAYFVYTFGSYYLTKLAETFVPHFNLDQVQNTGFSKSAPTAELAAIFVGLVILTPIFEEIVFRGILFRGLRQRTPFWLSAVLTSLVFAVAHGQWNVAVDVFALSLTMCFLVERSKSIYPTMLLHALKNGLAFVFLFVVK